MYKIIGADQKEYGPVSTDQLRQWIAEGRVNAQTLVQAAGESTWKPISMVPEFAASFPAGALPPLGGAPAFAGQDAHTRAVRDVTGPAIGLIVTAALGILFALWQIVQLAMGTNEARVRIFMQRYYTQYGQNPELERMVHSFSGAMGMALQCVGILICLFILFGALKMRKLENYGLSIAVSIVAMIPCLAPCFSPCCVVGLPIGIWALVILNKAEVKNSFT